MLEAPAYLDHAEHFIQAGPHRTRYIEAGDVGRPTVLLVHDGTYGTDSELCWSAVIAGLATDHHVLAPELLGWGATDKILDFCHSRYENQIKHLAAFCRALAVTEAHFVGTSFGGSVVIRAASEGARCELPMISTVSLSGTGGPFRRREAVLALGDYIPSLEGAEAISRLIMEPGQPTAAHIHRRYDVSLTHGHWEFLTAQQLRSPSKTVRRPPSPDVVESPRFPATFSRARMPVLLVEGVHDPINERGWGGQLASLNPYAEVLELDSGHSPNLDRPDEVVSAVKAFIGKVGSIHA